MDRIEFVEKLRMALNGRVDQSIVADTVRYYEGYINEEIAAGCSENEVLESLGDPRLIARSIIDANSGQRDGRMMEGTVSEEEPQQSGELQLKGFQLPAILKLGIGIAIVVGLIVLAIKALVLLAPALVTIAVVLFIVKLFREFLK